MPKNGGTKGTVPPPGPTKPGTGGSNQKLKKV